MPIPKELTGSEYTRPQRRWFWLFFIPYGLVIILPIIMCPLYAYHLSCSITIIGILMAMILYNWKRNRTPQQEDLKLEVEKKFVATSVRKRDITKTSSSLVVLSAIYAIVAGLAITEALG